MFIGSLADKSGWKWITAAKGLPRIIAKRTHSGKSGCTAEESRTPNGKKGYAVRMYIGFNVVNGLLWWISLKPLKALLLKALMKLLQALMLEPMKALLKPLKALNKLQPERGRGIWEEEEGRGKGRRRR